MTVNLKFIPNELIDHRAHSTKRVTLTGKLVNIDRRPVSVLSAWAQVCLAEKSDFVVVSRGYFNLHKPTLAPTDDSTAHLMIELPTPLLKAIETRRREGREAGVGLRLWVEAVAVPLVTLKDRNGQPVSDALAGPAESAQVRVCDAHDRNGDVFTIARDTWLDVLKKVGYGETEVFELPAFSLAGTDGHSKRMVERLHEAVTSLRASDASGALAKSRQAFESIASGLGSGNTGKGFGILLEAARPGLVEAPKREALNKLFSALADFQHLGRHDKPPFTPIDNADGELAVQLSLALGHYLSRQLAANQPAP